MWWIPLIIILVIIILLIVLVVVTTYIHEKGDYGDKITPSETNYLAAYKAAFDAAVLGDLTKVWDSNPSSSNNLNVTAAVLNYHWSTKFIEM